MKLVWAYQSSNFDREIAEEWIAAGNMTDITEIAIDENSLRMSARNGTFVVVNRHWDLLADLVEAAVSLRDHSHR